jgi:hypothetical protein
MAAGLGFKTFNTGDVLSAADVNGYLMQGVLVFADATARDAAITSPQEGQFAYTKDNNSLWYYTGSAWAASGATGDIEGVTAGTGISGGGTSGTVTITNSMATAIDAKGDLVVGTGADTFARLAVGTDNQRLVAASGEATGLKYIADTANTVIDAEGDLLVGDSADTLQRLAIGSNAQVLTVDTSVDGKIKWATPAAGSTFVGVKVTKSADQTIASATEAQITWNQEEFDTDGFHDNSTNNARLTVPTGQGGYYRIYAEMQWQNTSSTARKIIAVYLNGAVTQIGTFETGSIGFPSCIVSFTQNLSAGDYVQLYAYNGTAGNLDFRQSLAFFGMEKIG